MKKKFPKLVYVYHEPVDMREPDGEQYFAVASSTRNVASIEEERIVGVYELKETVSVKVAVIEKRVKK